MVQIRYEYPVTTYRQSKQLLLPYISRKNSTNKGQAGSHLQNVGPGLGKAAEMQKLPGGASGRHFALTTVGVFSPPRPSFGYRFRLTEKFHAHTRVRTLNGSIQYLFETN